jgi:regulatory protein
MKKPKRITEDYLYNSGLYYLNRFASSTQNFRWVMNRKIKRSCDFYPEQSIEQCAELLEKTIKKFQNAGLLNDELYASLYFRSLRGSGHSRKSILSKMTSKGLDRALIEDAFEKESCESEIEPEFKSALLYARKKRLGCFGDKEEKKSLASMARAGFSYNMAQKIINLDPQEGSDLIESLG